MQSAGRRVGSQRLVDGEGDLENGGVSQIARIEAGQLVDAAQPVLHGVFVQAKRFRDGLNGTVAVKVS